MVYYGRLSQGCQRCRQRKVKCDGRKPKCLRCEKAGMACPGFRNLTDLAFRDESERIMRKTVRHAPATRSPHLQQSSALQQASRSSCPAPILTSVPPTLFQPLVEQAASFFFSNYVRKGPPISDAGFAWLKRMYSDVASSHPLRVAIDSAGMAGLAKLLSASDAAVRSRILHGQALSSTKRALSDPAESVADVTLMTVLLLALYEFVNPYSWQNQSLCAHVRGAATLVLLRGPKQFESEVGANLFLQFRALLVRSTLPLFISLRVARTALTSRTSTKLHVCIQEDVAPPLVFEKLNRTFTASRIGQVCEAMAPRPLSGMYFRFLRLRAAIRNGTITDPAQIRRFTTEINNSLVMCVQDPDPWWDCSVVEAGTGDGPATDTFFEGKRHVYRSPWAAQMWTNWRTLRILVNQTQLQNEAAVGANESSSLAIIRQMSSDICISMLNLRVSPLTVFAIWPLTIIYRETLNHHHVRSWALSELRRISYSMGLGGFVYGIDDIPGTSCNQTPTTSPSADGSTDVQA